MTTPKPSELLPCPFDCGESTPEAFELGDVGFHWQIRCRFCGSRGPSCSSYHAAVAAWNRRACPSPVYNLVNTTPSTGDGGSVNTPTPPKTEEI